MLDNNCSEQQYQKAYEYSKKLFNDYLKDNKKNDKIKSVCRKKKVYKGYDKVSDMFGFMFNFLDGEKLRYELKVHHILSLIYLIQNDIINSEIDMEFQPIFYKAFHSILDKTKDAPLCAMYNITLREV